MELGYEEIGIGGKKKEEGEKKRGTPGRVVRKIY